MQGHEATGAGSGAARSCVRRTGEKGGTEYARYGIVNKLDAGGDGGGDDDEDGAGGGDNEYASHGGGGSGKWEGL
jgi:hypothetical protein